MHKTCTRSGQPRLQCGNGQGSCSPTPHCGAIGNWLLWEGESLSSDPALDRGWPCSSPIPLHILAAPSGLSGLKKEHEAEKEELVRVWDSLEGREWGWIWSKHIGALQRKAHHLLPWKEHGKQKRLRSAQCGCHGEGGCCEGEEFVGPGGTDVCDLLQFDKKMTFSREQ